MRSVMLLRGTVGEDWIRWRKVEKHLGAAPVNALSRKKTRAQR